MKTNRKRKEVTTVKIYTETELLAENDKATYFWEDPVWKDRIYSFTKGEYFLVRDRSRKATGPFTGVELCKSRFLALD